MRDDLLIWCRVRDSIDWAASGTSSSRTAAEQPGRSLPASGAPDGFVAFVRGPVAARDPDRAARLLDALTLVAAAVDAGVPVTFEVLAAWQAVVLGLPAVGFRTGPAFAKGGRERYGLRIDTADRFDRCLAGATDPAVPPAA